MFDNFIYRLLDKIVEWCERYKEYRISRTLPRACTDEKVKSDELKKWVDEQEKSYKSRIT